MRARRHAIIASVATGAALEFVVGAIGGRREAWDSALYWSAGLPAALAAAAAIGYFAGRRAWYWTGLIMPSQVMVMMLRGGEISGLWPLMVVLASVLGAPFLLAAFIASHLRPRG
jgi:hypothetical protein